MVPLVGGEQSPQPRHPRALTVVVRDKRVELVQPDLCVSVRFVHKRCERGVAGEKNASPRGFHPLTGAGKGAKARFHGKRMRHAFGILLVLPLNPERGHRRAQQGHEAKR